jgi:hypothetical protein
MGASLEGDGVCVSLFELLWRKDEFNFGPSVSLPDTVVFQSGQPVAWYFTSVDGKIKKKHRNNLMAVKIEEHFRKRTIGYDVIACFITTSGPGGVAGTSLSM